MARLIHHEIHTLQKSNLQTPSQGTGRSFLSQQISIGSGFSDKAKAGLYDLLGTLLNAGVSFDEAFHILIDQSEKTRVKKLLEHLLSYLEQGKTLSEAMGTRDRQFTPFEIHNVRMAEESGKLGEVLKSLANFFEKREQLRRKVLQTLAYPVVVLSVAFSVVAFMLGFVVPMFKDVFKRFDADLPRITIVILEISEFLQDFGIVIILVIAIFIFLLMRYRKAGFIRRISAAIILKLPLIGTLVHKTHTARWCYSLSLLMSSRVNLHHALELMTKIVPFYPFQQAMPQITTGVLAGKTLYQSIEDHSIFPPIVKRMIKVGEKTGSLDSMLEKTAVALEKESEKGLSMVMSLLEPLIIIVLGTIVGFILIAMYLPMFEMGNAINI